MILGNRCFSFLFYPSLIVEYLLLLNRQVSLNKPHNTCYTFSEIFYFYLHSCLTIVNSLIVESFVISLESNNWHAPMDYNGSKSQMAQEDIL